MADASQHDQDQKAYATIRQVASGQLKMWFDGVAFEPLFGQHNDVLSVTGRPFARGRGRGEPLWLTVWHGYRDGPGGDGSEAGFWLLIEESLHLQIVDPTWRRNANPVFLPIIVDAPGLGLTLPDLGVNEESLLELIGDMLKLLEAGIPVHRRWARRDEAFAALNAALQGEFPEEAEEDSAVEQLELLCAESDLESVEFGPFGAPGPRPFAASTFVDTEEQTQLTVWSDADGVEWVDVDGTVQKVEERGLSVRASDLDEAEFIVDAAVQLREIHAVARSIFLDIGPDRPEMAFELLNAVAFAAMNGSFDQGNPQDRPWHAWAEQFGGHCKLGFLAGVMLEESPFGNLNIRATTIDPVSGTSTDLQVYWKQDDEGEVPEHWLSVGTATAPAHDVDPEYPELLAGTPLEVRDYIRHAIGHLHEMVHLAGSVLEARAGEVVRFLDAKRAVEEVPDSVEHEMIRTAVEDAIAGLNGMARLYTGAMPS